MHAICFHHYGVRNCDNVLLHGPSELISVFVHAVAHGRSYATGRETTKRAVVEWLCSAVHPSQPALVVKGRLLVAMAVIDPELAAWQGHGDGTEVFRYNPTEHTISDKEATYRMAPAIMAEILDADHSPTFVAHTKGFHCGCLYCLLLRGCAAHSKPAGRPGLHALGFWRRVTGGGLVWAPVSDWPTDVDPVCVLTSGYENYRETHGKLFVDAREYWKCRSKRYDAVFIRKHFHVLLCTTIETIVEPRWMQTPHLDFIGYREMIPGPFLAVQEKLVEDEETTYMKWVETGKAVLDDGWPSSAVKVALDDCALGECMGDSELSYLLSQPVTGRSAGFSVIAEAVAMRISRRYGVAYETALPVTRQKLERDAW